MEVNAHSISSSFIYIFAFSHPAKQVMHCVKVNMVLLFQQSV